MKLFPLGMVATLITAGCTSAPKSAPSKPVFDLLQTHKLEKGKPLLGSYAAGTKAFESSNGSDEAAAVFKTLGPYYIEFCGYSCQPEGFQNMEDLKRVVSAPKYRSVIIPGTSDVWYAEKKPYFEASLAFSHKFNTKMLELVDQSH